MSQTRREYETQTTSESHTGRNLAIIALLATAGILVYDRVQNDTLIPSVSEEDSNDLAIDPLNPDINPTAVPMMIESEDTPLGFNSAAVNIEFNTIQDVIEMFTRMDVSPNSVQEENFLYRMYRADFVPNIDRMNPVTPEDAGMGHTEASTADYAREQARYNSLLTRTSAADAEHTDQAEVVTFRSNIFENNDLETVYNLDGRYATSTLMQNQYDNLDPMGLVQIADALKMVTVDGERVWDLLSQEQRLDFALVVWEGWDSQREEGPIGSPVERPITFINEDGEVEVLALTNTAGEAGIRVRRVERTQNGEDQAAEQRLTSECVIIIEQPNGDHTEIPLSEISRYEHVGSSVTFDLTAMNRIAENAGSTREMLTELANALIHTEAAYERLSLDTTYAGFPRSQTSEGDAVFLMRPGCAPIRVTPEATPVPEIVTPVPEVIVTNTPPPEETPPPTSTPRPEKDPIGDQSNPNGETNPDPTGGVINDPNAPQGSDTNPGSGH